MLRDITVNNLILVSSDIIKHNHPRTSQSIRPYRDRERNSYRKGRSGKSQIRIGIKSASMGRRTNGEEREKCNAHG